MPSREESNLAFHGRMPTTDGPASISWSQSFRNVIGAAWRNRGSLSANPVNSAKALLPELPLNDPFSKLVSNEVIHMLWGSMLHPPSSYRGAKFQYRSADGSNNSMLYPDLGKAGLPYAKSIQAQKPVQAAKPDVGDIFDLLMAREGDGRESDLGISSLLLYQATIIIHDVFRTNDNNRNISDTSSYLDLSPLYGKDFDAQKTVRTFKNGLLKPDTFAEHRLLNQPPGVSIFLIMYNRFHNYVAKQLIEINENGKFSRPVDFDAMEPEYQERALKKIDEDLFQTARLITCGLYVQVAIHDYLRVLMLMHEKDTAWTLDPRCEYNGFLDKETVARGQGNMVSVEFNLLYRFHSPLSKRDADWSTDLFKFFLQGKFGLTEEQIENGDVTVHQMGEILKQTSAAFQSGSAEREKPHVLFPKGFDFVGKTDKEDFVFQRDEDGYFDDAQMVAELVRVMEDPMYSFGAQQVPKVFKSIEMLGILQSRKWEVCTLNEFRKFFGLEPHANFASINSDKEMQQRLCDLYGDVDSVELYPGFLCEGAAQCADPNVNVPGGGGPALWRGIFSDAVTLVRSDRFYTTEWNVDAITAYGMKEVTSDPTINKGGLLWKLCQRAFPGYFKYNSLHLWEPYYTPARNLVLAYQQGKLKDLDFDGLEFRHGEHGEWKDLSADQVTQQMIKDIERSHALVDTKNKGRLKVFRVRRKLTTAPGFGNPSWRGRERASKVESLDMVSIGDYTGPAGSKTDFGDYTTIKQKILGGKEASNWANPAIRAAKDIPQGPLRDIMTNQFDSKLWKKAMGVLEKSLGTVEGHELDTSLFRKYFTVVADEILDREKRTIQRGSKAKPGHVFQLDVVTDYAIPITVRFVADWLGFWYRVKTTDHLDREFFENAVYDLLDNCQDYQSWDADQTKAMKRRQLFQASIKKLKELADDGARRSGTGILWWRNLFRSYGTGKDAREVLEMRKLAVTTTQALYQAGFSADQVASLMLHFALESVHKLVLNFTEVLAYFIDPKTADESLDGEDDTKQRAKRWGQIQQWAVRNNEESDMKILKYVREAQRLTPSVKLARQYVGSETTKLTTTSTTGVKTDNKIVKGQTILIDLQAANRNSKVFPKPNKFDPERNPESYLIYGAVIDEDNVRRVAPLTKQLSLAYLTALVKHTSTLRCVRVAHDKLGRLKRVETPSSLPGYPAAGALKRYMSPEWDTLLPFPVTWQVRFNGIYDGTGVGVWTCGDNADQGHGLNQIWQDDDTYILHEAPNAELKSLIKSAVDDEVKKATEEIREEVRKIGAGKKETTGVGKKDTIGGLKRHGAQVTVQEVSSDCDACRYD